MSADYRDFEFIDSKEAFDEAIAAGLLSADPSAENHAGAFMYMGTDPIAGHAFKAIDTRQYVYMADAL